MIGQRTGRRLHAYYVSLCRAEWDATDTIARSFFFHKQLWLGKQRMLELFTL